MRRDILVAVLFWIALTVVVEVLVAVWDLFPLAAAEEAAVVDDAFRVLMLLGIPVFSFALVTLVYSVLRFRRSGEPTEDGPPVHSHRGVIAGWFLVTTALTIAVIFFPGVTGLLEVRESGDREPDLVVQVQGSQWVWLNTYPQYGVLSVTELVLPVGKTIRFDVTSTDVLHAFWVPAFRMKIDAVRGRVTESFVTPNEVGSFGDDPGCPNCDSGFRLQCAELCGRLHGAMVTPVRVVEPSEFEAWVVQQAPA
ncbi:MAG: cytochrome c oxidase subunit II [Dehalococcoidia bacterium]